MVEIKIKISPSLRTRFLAEVPPLDRDNFASCALLEALDKRDRFRKDAAIMTQENQSAVQPRRGRPATGLTREKRTINMEPRAWAWLESQATPEDRSFSDTCNRVVLGMVSTVKKD